MVPSSTFLKEGLSPHFTFTELTVTKNAPHIILNRLLAREYIFNLTLLANYILEPVRILLGGALFVTSGYRCVAVNKMCKGSKNSQHLQGCAADFKVKHISLEEAYSRIKNCSLISFGQLILERGWLHISLGQPFRESKKCRESFKIV